MFELHSAILPYIPVAGAYIYAFLQSILVLLLLGHVVALWKISREIRSTFIWPYVFLLTATIVSWSAEVVFYLLFVHAPDTAKLIFPFKDACLVPFIWIPLLELKVVQRFQAIPCCQWLFTSAIFVLALSLSLELFFEPDSNSYFVLCLATLGQIIMTGFLFYEYYHNLHSRSRRFEVGALCAYLFISIAALVEFVISNCHLSEFEPICGIDFAKTFSNTFFAIYAARLIFVSWLLFINLYKKNDSPEQPKPTGPPPAYPDSFHHPDAPVELW